MRNGRTRLLPLLLAAYLWIPSVAGDRLAAQDGPPASGPGSAEAVVRELYDLVTFPAGATPDWDRGRSLFLPEGVVVLRTTRTATTVFSVEGWVQDFVDFIEGQRDGHRVRRADRSDPRGGVRGHRSRVGPL
jgi:hypothetical protein